MLHIPQTNQTVIQYSKALTNEPFVLFGEKMLLLILQEIPLQCNIYTLKNTSTNLDNTKKHEVDIYHFSQTNKVNIIIIIPTL